MHGDKNPNDNKIHGKVKSTGIFNKRQVLYFDFEQRLTETKSLQSLVHPANDKRDSAKAKDKQKTNAPTSAPKPALKTLLEKDEFNAKKRERQRKESSS